VARGLRVDHDLDASLPRHADVAQYVEAFRELRDAKGLRLVVRNGYKPERELQTGLGAVPVKPPRLNDRRSDEDGERLRFESKILPRYMRRTRSLDELIPWLYLKGISTGDMSDALAAILGKDAPGLSASTVVRLKEGWEEQFKAWSSRSLEGKRYVYFWVDGIYANVRLEEDRPCILVVLGATAEGVKELVAVQDGYRESEQSWLELLVGLKNRGLGDGPELVVGDGALGFWKAVKKVYPKARWQRCWVHVGCTVDLLSWTPSDMAWADLVPGGTQCIRDLLGMAPLHPVAAFLAVRAVDVELGDDRHDVRDVANELLVHLFVAEADLEHVGSAERPGNDKETLCPDLLPQGLVVEDSLPVLRFRHRKVVEQSFQKAPKRLGDVRNVGLEAVRRPVCWRRSFGNPPPGRVGCLAERTRTSPRILLSVASFWFSLANFGLRVT